jgi:hypothetical protein
MDFSIPYTAEFRQTYIEPRRDHNRNPPDKPLNPWLLSNGLESSNSFSPIPTNRDHNELLEVKVVSQPDEKFKNKKQVLFGGSTQDQKMALRTTLNGVSFIILSYAFYLHEARALLRRISRTGFLMTYNELMLSTFKRKLIQLPLYLNRSLVCKSLFLDYGFRVTNPKLKDIKKDHQQCSTFTSPHYVKSLDKFVKLQSLSIPLDFCP